MDFGGKLPPAHVIRPFGSCSVICGYVANAIQEGKVTLFLQTYNSMVECLSYTQLVKGSNPFMSTSVFTCISSSRLVGRANSRFSGLYREARGGLRFEGLSGHYRSKGCAMGTLIGDGASYLR